MNSTSRLKLFREVGAKVLEDPDDRQARRAALTGLPRLLLNELVFLLLRMVRRGIVDDDLWSEYTVAELHIGVLVSSGLSAQLWFWQTFPLVHHASIIKMIFGVWFSSPEGVDYVLSFYRIES